MPNFDALLPRFAQQTIAVVGDLILDEYMIGDAARMSREAPIPVLELRERLHVAGGAGNPAFNLAALGATTHLYGVVGNDAAAATLQALVSAHSLTTDGIIAVDDRPTTVKTRIMAQMGLRFPQQVARVDHLVRHPLTSPSREALLQAIRLAPRPQAILCSDYHCGVLTPETVDALRLFGQTQGILLTADAQGALEKYHEFDLVKCNAEDARAYAAHELLTGADFAQVAEALRHSLNVGAVVITRGSDGATLAAPDGVWECPAPAVRDVYDTVGAGDTSIAVMTLAKCAGASWQECVQLANIASGIVIQHVGNYAPTLAELADAAR